MPIQTGINRDEFEFNSLEFWVDSDSEVRVIDLFLDMVDYDDLGFTIKDQVLKGGLLLQLMYCWEYMYAYLNQIRSSRKLERSCRHNVELWWVTGKLLANIFS